ncbi:hypothetical protein Vretimale_9900 [Volvox reticuliferus]|uniref:Uncharacterized protein n=1 Tax=Volvox reticuliferus TaxID=1737510 RepID=A0A8J4LQ86_9CHLO|nr:hypothetical protein Vretimale_9900 [Volvox reticuliferus]
MPILVHRYMATADPDVVLVVPLVLCAARGSQPPGSLLPLSPEVDPSSAASAPVPAVPVPAAVAPAAAAAAGSCGSPGRTVAMMRLASMMTQPAGRRRLI